ncbi:phospholipase D-like protein [Thermosporothrix hazakensis]|jgi:glucan phosphoethanolaminetransferase (alkaline phosphatase superfamily)|uniref:Phospholipase D-like protein n=2 Tax=Thermosporothrix hazakensis TaxID=644383 RepID=A0A326U7K0_THEHA|nr:PLD nuclease N-terminal domain-containing protein [Thermosporothrix hazakensis]PZW29502.1 phospholipase D-like protein [Thermosporothrix hazakensis]GCE45783.1 hypothetical protein KTH_06520 [Thermosporothrix hazakensis]
MGLVMFLFFLLVFAVIAILSILLVVFWIWMLVDCLKNRGISDTMKLLWVVLMILFSPIASFVYFFTDRKKAKIQYYYEPMRIQARQASWSASYHASYQARSEPRSASEAPATPSRAQWEQYEEPRAIYPEPPQEQQQQQWRD